MPAWAAAPAIVVGTLDLLGVLLLAVKTRHSRSADVAISLVMSAVLVACLLIAAVALAHQD